MTASSGDPGPSRTNKPWNLEVGLGDVFIGGEELDTSETVSLLILMVARSPGYCGEGNQSSKEQKTSEMCNVTRSGEELRVVTLNAYRKHNIVDG